MKNLQITINGIKIKSKLYLKNVEYYNNINSVKLKNLILYLINYYSKNKGTIDITTFNPQVSIKINVADKENELEIKQIIQKYLGVILFI